MTGEWAWVLPTATGLGGLAGLAALITAIVNSRSSTFTQLQQFTTAVQAERNADRERYQQERLEDRERHAALDSKVTMLQGALGLWPVWEAEILAWGRAGGPPPEPKRPPGLTVSITN